MVLRSHAILCAMVSLLAISCAHPSIRASRRTIDRLTRTGGHFVLVFGSLSTPGGKIDRPAIRFLHPENEKPDTLLWSTTIATGGRFYAILPAADAFYVEVGSEPVGFDRILYRRLRADQEPLAIYVGEIEVRPAASRATRGQKVSVETRDDFQHAQRELHRLYPGFDGVIVSAVLNRPAPPPR